MQPRNPVAKSVADTLSIICIPGIVHYAILLREINNENKKGICGWINHALDSKRIRKNIRNKKEAE